MIPSINTLSIDRLQNVTGVFFDIDDTFSHRGKIPASAYTALWALKQAGYKVVPITGRPAGWCDHIARMWPVDGVVGENGAFYFRVDHDSGSFVRRFIDDDHTRLMKREKLKRIGEEILGKISGTALASDQNYREADLAVDFCEDVPRLSWDAVDGICQIFTAHGATCKVSSIHVNGWFGDYSKLEMTRTLARELWDMDLDAEKSRFIYLGDSPNDEPMFRYFPLSVGVSNVLAFTDRMTFLPAYVTVREGGEGFAETVDLMLKKINVAKQ
ncbi:HAD-IIB family hydrolase [Desulfatiferula olefinivorans]